MEDAAELRRKALTAEAASDGDVLAGHWRRWRVAQQDDISGHRRGNR